MKKFNKVFMMVMMVMVLVVLTGACQKADVDPIEQDDVQFVSVNSVVTARYDGFADVTTTFVFRVKTFAPTRLEGEVRIGNQTRLFGVDVPNTNGQWFDVSREYQTIPNFGVIETSGSVTMLSISKVVIIPPTQFTVQ
jgi:hypothetical protein